MVKLVKFKEYIDNNGKLVPFYCNSKKDFPFLNKRIFLVYGKKFKEKVTMHTKNVSSFYIVCLAKLR